MNPPPDGPEHLPLPPSPRGDARRRTFHRAAAGIPGPQAVIVLLAIAFAGAAVWLSVRRATAEPAAAIARRLAAPAPVMMGAVPQTVVSLNPRMETSPAAAPPKPQKAALPEPPTADESAAPAPRAETAPSAKGAQLFNRSVGFFVPYKDQPERRVVSPLPAQPPAVAPPIDDEDAAEIKKYGHTID